MGLVITAHFRDVTTIVIEHKGETLEVLLTQNGSRNQIKALFEGSKEFAISRKPRVFKENKNTKLIRQAAMTGIVTPVKE